MNEEVRNRYMEFQTTISGQKSFQERWEECVNFCVSYLPIATSALYVENFFKNESRDAAWEIVNSIRDEFRMTLNVTEWMDEETKERALEKAKTMQMHIGYPDELTDERKLMDYYEGLEVDEKKFFASVLNVTRFDTRKLIKNFRLPVNRTDWEEHAYVAVVNAFYNPVENSIRECFFECL